MTTNDNPSDLDRLRELAAEVLKQRSSRNRGGADDCYRDNARSRDAENRAIEAIIAALTTMPAEGSARSGVP